MQTNVDSFDSMVWEAIDCAIIAHRENVIRQKARTNGELIHRQAIRSKEKSRAYVFLLLLFLFHLFRVRV